MHISFKLIKLKLFFFFFWFWSILTSVYLLIAAKSLLKIVFFLEVVFLGYFQAKIVLIIEIEVKVSNISRRKNNDRCTYYLDFRVEVVVNGFNLVSTFPSKCSNLQVLLPRMAKTKTAMSWFPPCQICLCNIITLIFDQSIK